MSGWRTWIRFAIWAVSLGLILLGCLAALPGIGLTQLGEWLQWRGLRWAFGARPSAAPVARKLLVATASLDGHALHRDQDAGSTGNVSANSPRVDVESDAAGSPSSSTEV